MTTACGQRTFVSLEKRGHAREKLSPESRKPVHLSVLDIEDRGGSRLGRFMRYHSSRVVAWRIDQQEHNVISQPLRGPILFDAIQSLVVDVRDLRTHLESRCKIG